ncbi:MAG TPA: DUF4340 domain-containing protein [Thermoanaerobaculia bacterium]|nr:DUF4340 domain-containing protein [Thermoanaerobaculia bacterium]
MKPRTLLVLLVLVLGLGAYIAFYDRKLPSTEEREKSGNKVLDVAKEDVQAVEIERLGQVVRLEKVKAPTPAKSEKTSKPEEAASEPAPEWRMTRPRVARADGQLVSSLLEAVVGLGKTRTLEKPDPKAVGLDHPQATVRLTTAKGTQTLRFGAKIPTGAEVVVGVSGDRDAYVASDSILASFEHAPGDWRDRQVLSADRDHIERVTLTGPAGTTVLARKGESFEIESPPALRDRADRDLVEGLLTDLTGLRAQQFLDDSKETPAALGLEPPHGTVEVAVQGGAPIRVDLGNAAPPAASAPPAEGTPPPSTGGTVYTRVGPQILTAQTGLAADVARAPGDWRSRALSRFQVYQVESAKMTDASGTVAVDRGSGTDWKRGKDTISYTPVSDLLFALAGGSAKASQVLGPEEAKKQGLALEKPLVTVILKGEKGAGEETLTFYPPGPTGAPVTTSGRSAVLLLPSDKLAEIEKQIAAIRTVAPLAPEKPAKGGK